MISANRFWLSMHQLSRDYMDEGTTNEERLAAILSAFRLMSPDAQRELRAEFAPLIATLGRIYTALRSEQASPDGNK